MTSAAREPEAQEHENVRDRHGGVVVHVRAGVAIEPGGQEGEDVGDVHAAGSIEVRAAAGRRPPGTDGAGAKVALVDPGAADAAVGDHARGAGAAGPEDG